MREQQVERGVAAAERGGVVLAAADDHTAARERAEDAEHQPAYERGAADELPALEELPEHAGLAFALPVRRPLISLMPKNTVSAVARKVSALKYSATALGCT